VIVASTQPPNGQQTPSPPLWRSVAICAVIGCLLPAAYGLLIGIQDPVVHDEYAYLLGADTFASGRLTNPAPQFPLFFESEHILVTPTYQSKYPPAQSLAMAVGQATTGHPISGVWLTCGLFAASLMWMLDSWTSRHYAFAVTVGTVITVGTTTYWAQSYWGGMLGASGAAIVFGALRRTITTPQASTSILLATGVLLLANARPFEGLLATIPAAVVIGWWFFRDGPVALGRKARTVLAPVMCVLALGTIGMMIYNRAVTGDVLRSPYALHIDQYLYRGVFLFSGFREPERRAAERVDGFYRDLAQAEPVLSGATVVRRAVQNFALRLPLSVGSALGFFPDTARPSAPYRGVLVWLLILPPVWMGRSLSSFTILSFLVVALELALCQFLPFYPVTLLPMLLVAMLIALDWRLPDKGWSLFGFAVVVLVVSGQALVVWWLPHYPAPFYPVILGLWAAALYQYSLRLHAGPMRYSIVAVILMLHTVGFAMSAYGESQSPSTYTPAISREQVRRDLLRRGGRHLILVSYDRRYSPHREWVYNDADLINTPVLFAHDLGPAQNERLIASSSDRMVWKLVVTPENVDLQSYAVAGAR
jgi:hypothetical protein